MKEDPQPERKTVRFVTLYVPFMSSLCVFGSLFAGEGIHLLLPRSYAGSIPYIGPLLLGNLFVGLYYFAALPLFAYEKVSWCPVITAGATGIDLALNLWLIPWGGALAAAWVFVPANILKTMGFFLISRRYDKTAFPLLQYGLILTLTCGIILLSACQPELAWIVKLAILAGFAIMVTLVSRRVVRAAG